mmetsp:Transcript_34618/g.104344  ORF Transcript_34618/g.104344 Transcript_34618/m.104344 type:complete len:242 (-) Transcript_34618:1069-1794(-)
MGSSRGAKAGPWRSVPCTQRSTSWGCRLANVQSCGARPRASTRKAGGTKTRWIRSSPASMATALLAPATMAPLTAAGQASTIRPAQPASSKRCTSCTNLQHCATSAPIGSLLTARAAAAQAATSAAPPCMAVTASLRRLADNSPPRSMKKLAGNATSSWFSTAVQRTACRGNCGCCGCCAGLAGLVKADIVMGVATVAGRPCPVSSASSAERWPSSRPTASRRQSVCNNGRCSFMNSWPPG